MALAGFAPEQAVGGMSNAVFDSAAHEGRRQYMDALMLGGDEPPHGTHDTFRPTVIAPGHTCSA